MASEKSYVTTPLKREVVVQLENLREDIWEARIIYANRVHMVGKFQGKNHAIEGARKKAEQSLTRQLKPARESLVSRARRKTRISKPTRLTKMG